MTEITTQEEHKEARKLPDGCYEAIIMEAGWHEDVTGRLARIEAKLDKILAIVENNVRDRQRTIAHVDASHEEEEDCASEPMCKKAVLSFGKGALEETMRAASKAGMDISMAIFVDLPKKGEDQISEALDVSSLPDIQGDTP